MVKSNAIVTDSTAAEYLVTVTTGGTVCTAALVTGLSGTALGYYIDQYNTGNLITCVTGSPVTCTSSSGGASDSAPKHFLQGGASPSVITCNSSGCSLEDKTSVKGYFINSAGTTGKAILSCNGSSCSNPADKTTCVSANAGGVKVAGGKVYLCIANNDNDGTNHVEIKVGASASTKTITVGAGDFPGITPADTITIKIGADGSALYQAPEVVATGNYK